MWPSKYQNFSFQEIVVIFAEGSFIMTLQALDKFALCHHHDTSSRQPYKIIHVCYANSATIQLQCMAGPSVGLVDRYPRSAITVD